MKYFLSQLVPQRIKNLFYHLPMALIAAVWFGFPARRALLMVSGQPLRRMKVIGVTGTNGKTTTVQFITRILQKSGRKVAAISTINFVIAHEERTNISKYTTLSAWQTQKFLEGARRKGCEYVVLETSSHALDQHRVLGIPFEMAVITNVTREHLDYHRTMAAYRRAKRHLFERARMAVVNADMITPEEYLEAKKFSERLSYSTKDEGASVLAEHITSDLSGSSFTVDGTRYTIALPGLYNIENALAAIASGTLLGIAPEEMRSALADVRLVPGRMEEIPNERGLRIFIDYAVTPDSLEKLYALVSSMKGGSTRILSVFGACGERDRGKRPMMGEIVSSVADICILTNEDPYHEDPERIIREVAAGIRNKTKDENLFIIFDRREAIKKALSLASPGDIILVTGKGAEETMAIGDARIPWSDRAVITQLLRDTK